MSLELEQYIQSKYDQNIYALVDQTSFSSPELFDVKTESFWSPFSTSLTRETIISQKKASWLQLKSSRQSLSGLFVVCVNKNLACQTWNIVGERIFWALTIYTQHDFNSSEKAFVVYSREAHPPPEQNNNEKHQLFIPRIKNQVGGLLHSKRITRDRETHRRPA